MILYPFSRDDNLSKHSIERRWLARFNGINNMLVIRRRQRGPMASIIVSKDQSRVDVLVVVGVGQPAYLTSLSVEILAKVRIE